LGVPIPIGIVLAVSHAAVVVQAVLQIDAYRLGVASLDDVGVFVPAHDVGEAADSADDFAELIGALPGDREGTDGARRCAGDGAVVGIVGDAVGLLELGEQFVADQARVLVIEGVVLDAAVVGAVAPVLVGGFLLLRCVAGIDEDP